MSPVIEHLLKNSNLPGPRGNLELLYSFSKTAVKEEVSECLTFITDDVHNSPEEFVGMCGIVGYCILNREHIPETLDFIRKFASHQSWRIRESAAIGIQEIALTREKEILSGLRKWMDGNELEKRAVVAALCEPKLLKDKGVVSEVFVILDAITLSFSRVSEKLNDGQTSLRKALGYGWSVAIAAHPEEGKKKLEKLAFSENKHIRWIVKENLKKNRLIKLDPNWVEKMKTVIN